MQKGVVDVFEVRGTRVRVCWDWELEDKEGRWEL